MTAKPLRVDIVVNSLGIGGAERHALSLANALGCKGFAVRVIALSETDGQHRQSVTPISTTAIQLNRRHPVDLQAMRAYRRLLHDDPPALNITVNQYPLAFVWAATLLMRRTPVLQILHTIELPHEDNALKRWLYPRLMRVPKALIYVCELQRQHWRKAGIQSRPDHCIHNGVDVFHFKPVLTQTLVATRTSLGLSDGDFVVGLCAVMRPEKRHDLLLKAIAQLRQNGEPVHALLIGDGPGRAIIGKLARDLGIEGAVHVTGYQQDVRPFIAASDVMCLVSDYETFSLSILEAMAMAKPVVATRAGAVQEQITDGENGLLIPRDDVHALANALLRLRDAPERALLGQRAMAKVQTRFTADLMIERYAHIVRQLSVSPE